MKISLTLVHRLNPSLLKDVGSGDTLGGKQENVNLRFRITYRQK